MIGKQRISATVDADLVAAAERAASQGEAKNVSAWINEAMRLRLERDVKVQALRDFIADHEAEHGVITDEEIARVAREMKARALVVRGRKRVRRASPKRTSR